MNNQLRLIAKLKQQPKHGAGPTAFELLKDQAEQLYKTFETGGKDVVRASGFTLVGEAAINAYEKVNVLEKQNRKLSESFGVNTIRAAQLSKSFDTLGLKIGVNTDKLKTYAGELKKLFPGQAAYLANAKGFGERISKQLDLMRNKMGLSAEVTEGFIRNQALLSKTSADNFDSVDAQIAEFSRGLRGSYEGAFTDITEGIGNLDAETAAVFGRKGIGNLSGAVLGCCFNLAISRSWLFIKSFSFYINIYNGDFMIVGFFVLALTFSRAAAASSCILLILDIQNLRI